MIPIPIIHLSDDTQIKELLIRHGRVTDLDPPDGFVVQPGGFRTHCVWATEDQYFAVTRYAGYEDDTDNGYCAIIMDGSTDEQIASNIIAQFIQQNHDAERPCYSMMRKVNQEAN